MNKKAKDTLGMDSKPDISVLEKTLNDLEHIYQMSFNEGNLALALKAKEIISKICGFFDKKKDTKPFDITKASEEELETIIAQLRDELET